MKLDGDQVTNQSYMGACLTVIILVTTLMFTYTKAITIIDK